MEESNESQEQDMNGTLSKDVGGAGPITGVDSSDATFLNKDTGDKQKVTVGPLNMSDKMKARLNPKTTAKQLIGQSETQLSRAITRATDEGNIDLLTQLVSLKEFFPKEIVRKAETAMSGFKDTQAYTEDTLANLSMVQLMTVGANFGLAFRSTQTEAHMRDAILNQQKLRKMRKRV